MHLFCNIYTEENKYVVTYPLKSVPSPAEFSHTLFSPWGYGIPIVCRELGRGKSDVAS